MPGKDGWPGKIIQAKTDFALYDLSRDPGERYDVKEIYPEILNELKMLAEKMREDLGDENLDLPGANRRQPGSLKK